ncbi:MAG: peptidylprolyl isomerase [candidate division Zixibacteria bacterium]|nr:peptidylprolyl isomerase [candidate division Zixibacteria bacterium]
MISMDGRQKRWPMAAVLLATIVLICGCGNLQRKYVIQDKKFRITYIEDSRTNDNSLLINELLVDSEPSIRTRAALAIGRVGGDMYRAGLRTHLFDSIEVAAEAKFFAAGLCGDSSFIDTLLILAGPGHPARSAAIEAVGRLADSTRAEQLAGFLNDTDSLVAYQALLALWRSKGWSQAEQMAQIGLTTSNRKILYGALYALARGGRIEGRPLFHIELSDPDPEYRMLAYAGLGRTADTAAFDMLAAGVNDSDDRVVANVLTALESFGGKGTTVIGQNIGRFDDEKVLALALEAIGRKPFNGAAPIAENILRSDSRENILAAACKTILMIQGAGALPTIDQTLPQPTPWEKQNIAEGLGKTADPRAVERLRYYLSDPIPAVRLSALEAACEADTTACAGMIRAALSDTDFTVQTTAIDLASRKGLTELIPDIARLYEGDPLKMADDLKRGIIGAWATLAADTLRNRQFDTLMIATLEEAINDQWRVIRKEAIDILWEWFHIDRRDRIGLARSKVEKNNYRRLSQRFPANPTAIITTSRGTITIELLYDQAPLTVDNFITLAEKGFYNNRIFHRVVPNFVIQDGCPRGDGWGGPGYAIRCEYNRLPYLTGTVGMALSGQDTGGSQYFITLSPQPHLDGRYTVFGRVLSGMDAARQMVRGDSIRTVTIQYPKGGS